MGEAKRREETLNKKREEFMKDKKVVEIRADIDRDSLPIFFESMKQGLDKMKELVGSMPLVNVHIETIHSKTQTTIVMQALVEDSLIIKPSAITIVK